jgi:hypothetical protein
MMVSIGQAYIKPGVNFPFSHLMQNWVSEELSSVAEDCVEFQKKYGSEFELIVRISADTQIADNVLKGPTVFRKSKDVEYSVFLPFDTIVKAPEGCRVAMGFLMAGICSVFQKVGIDPTKLDERKAIIIDRVCSDPTMLKQPWPYGRESFAGRH